MIQVISLDTHSDSVTALCFHPYHPLLVTSDGKGFIRVTNYQDSTLANSFHVTNGEGTVAHSVCVPAQPRSGLCTHLTLGLADCHAIPVSEPEQSCAVAF